MAIIRYEFCDGAVSEAEVSDELYAVIEDSRRAERNSDRRESRRHVSMEYLERKGFQFETEAPDGDPLAQLLRRERKERLQEIIPLLLPQQRDLIEKIFFEGIEARKIAESEGISKSAISHRLERIYEKLKRFLK